MFKSFMNIALEQAKIAKTLGEVPVGAVIVDIYTNEIISFSHNSVEQDMLAISHAEINAIQLATKKLQTKYLDNCAIYVTLEPCQMCKTAINLAKIPKIFFGAYEDNKSALNKQYHHKCEIYGGILEYECSQILKNFFQDKR